MMQSGFDWAGLVMIVCAAIASFFGARRGNGRP